MKKTNQGGENFNDYFSVLLDGLGYGDLAAEIRKSPDSMYLFWEEINCDQRFFRYLNEGFGISQEVKWSHRKFLNDLFLKGEGAVKEASKFSKSNLEKSVENTMQSNSEEQVSMRIYQDPRKYMGKSAPSE